ncbi:hypothetical protein B0H12DRAFT_586366 [Mycena haematopus]|nr:hypothetical protein B0H12DRAFT_586366 [Mycena haematopus]
MDIPWAVNNLTRPETSHILYTMSRGPSDSESWRTEKIVEQPEGLEESDAEVDAGTQPDENMTTSSPAEWLTNWQSDKARWEEERAKWQQDHAHYRSGPPNSPSTSGPTPTPLQGGPSPEPVHGQSSGGEAGQDVGWLRRLWGRQSGRSSESCKADANTVPQQ